MARILILVGTESGNAQMVADALKPVLIAAGHKVDVTDKAATVGDLEAHEVFLVVSATHGSGEIALGDRTYQDTFCGGGKKLDQVFASCGARKLGERLEVDAASQPLPDEEAL